MYKVVNPAEPSLALGDTQSINILQLLKSKWDELHDQADVFRYKIDNLQEKYVEKYFLQLNPDRCIKRRAPETIESICQPFDHAKFNFTKVSDREILFNLVEEYNELKTNSILINVSPINRFHMLMCPSVTKCLPQVITEDSLVLVLQLMFIIRSRDLRIGFNSLHGMASVNHLHYHMFLVPNSLAVETAKCKNLKGPLYCIIEDTVPAFCFQIKSPESVAEFSKQIFKIFPYLLSNSIAHNVLLTRGASLVPGENETEVVRVVVWPRRSTAGAKQMGAFNVAVCELAGWFPVYDKTAYETLTTEDYENELRKWKIDNFDTVCDDVKSMF